MILHVRPCVSICRRRPDPHLGPRKRVIDCNDEVVDVRVKNGFAGNAYPPSGPDGLEFFVAQQRFAEAMPSSRALCVERGLNRCYVRAAEIWLNQPNLRPPSSLFAASVEVTTNAADFLPVSESSDG